MLEIADLRRVLRYEPETGKLFWLPRPVGMFKDEKQSASQNAAAWNARFAGKEAFTTVKGDGYKVGRVFYETHPAHRVIWAMVHGSWPADEVDHINGIRDDNRISNLRAVTHTENGRNSARPSHNTSGATGVHWHKQRGKWQSRIKVDQVTMSLGLYASFADAVAARKAAEAKYGFHENHGRKAA